MQLDDMVNPGSDAPILTAREAGLVACRRCARVWPGDTPRCDRCGGRLRSRDTRSLLKVWTWWAAGVATLIPAQVLPMLQSKQLFFAEEVTILGSVAGLFGSGSWALAAVIVVTSVIVPVAKLLAIAALALSVGRSATVSPAARHRIFEIVELVGRWSMIDVFVVAILAALVQFSVVATIAPGPASLAFAVSVISTMMAARAFDTRLIWDATPAR